MSCGKPVSKSLSQTRREWAEKSGLGFFIPSKKFSQRRLLDGMDGKGRKTPDVHFAATA
jgi:hypothetical protein